MRTEPATRKPLAEWLQDAYAGDTGCPPPGAYLEAAEGILPAAKMEELTAHADRCPACAAERELAAHFQAGEATGLTASGDPVSPEDMDYVVSRLESRFGNPQQPASTPSRLPRLLRFPTPGRMRFQNWVQLAAVVILVIGLGSVIRSLGPAAPTLPGSGPGEVVRGTTIAVLAPVGELGSLPTQLRWQPTDGAAGYHVQLTTVAGEALIDERVTLPGLEIPSEVQSRLHENAVYTWQVEAVDGDGSLIAWSGPVEFRLE